uniref:Uncharacterized protein n=1 Tax=Fagus sylvatica TaxID=28930 RepID=A0A2N9HZ18_FAGSY
MRHIVGKLSTSSFQRYKVCANRSSDEGVMAPGSRGVGAVFVHSSDAKIPVKRGMLSANREFHDVAGVIIFPTHPGSRINLLRAGKTLRAKAALPMSDFDVLGTVGKLALPIFARFRIRGKSELGLVRYGPASRVHRGVFGPFEGSFPIRIPADPDKFLAIREFHVVHGCVLLSNVPGLADQLVASQEDSVRKRGNVGGKIPGTFSKTLFCRPVFTRVVDVAPDVGFPTILVSSESLRYLLFNGTGLAQRRAWELLTIRKLRVVAEVNLLPKGLGSRTKGGQFDPVFGLVNGPVKPWSNLVNLGQTWSNLVKALQTLGNVSRTYISRVSGQRWVLVGLETARSNLGQTLVNSSQTWSTLVKLGQTLGNVSRTFFLGVFDGDEPSSDQAGLGSGCLVLRADTRENPGVCLGLRASPSGVQMGIPGLGEDRSGCEKTIRGLKWTLIDDQSSPIRPIGKHLSIPTFLFSFERCKSGTNRPGPPRSRNEICDSGPNRSGPPSPRNGDELGTNRPGPPRSRNEICDSGPNRSGPPSPRNGDELGTNRPGPPRSRNEICDSGPNRSGPPSPRNGDESGTNRPGPSRSRNGICDSGPNRSGPPSPRNGDESGTNRPGPPRSRNEICDSGPNRSGPPSPRNGDELGTNRPGPPRSRNEICDSTFCQSRNLAVRPILEIHPSGQGKIMSDRGSGSGGHRRSDRLAKGKAVAYAPESSPDTDDEYGAMEDVRTRLDASLARNLQAELDAEAAGLAPSAARPPPRPGVVIGRSARPSETTRPSPQPGVTTGPSDAPSAAPRRPHTRSTGIPPSRLKRQRTEGIPDSAGTIPEDYVAPGFRYPPHGGIRPRYPVAVEISDTPLLTNLLAHPSSLVRRCQVLSYFRMSLPDSAGRGGWSDFCRLLEASRPEYREFLIELGFGPFLSIPYVSVYHPAVWCFIERFFHHTGTFHLSTCEMAVLPVDWRRPASFREDSASGGCLEER